MGEPDGARYMANAARGAGVARLCGAVIHGGGSGAISAAGERDEAQNAGEFSRWRAAARHAGRPDHALHGTGIRAHYAGRDCGQHVGLCRVGHGLGHGSEDCDFALHLGHLSGDGFPAHFRGLAWAESRGAGDHGARLLGAYLGGSCAAAKRSGAMKLLVTGVSHKTAPVEVRERLAFSETALPAALRSLVAREGILEVLVLSTCNRVEIAVSADDAVDPVSSISSFFEEIHGVESATLGPCLYHHEGRDAIHHMFRVASSLDSMVVGEPQILGQLKAAYAQAKSNDCLNGLLESVVARAFNVAKRVRSETGIGQMAVSVSYAAVELARKIFGSLDGRTVMIVGSGKMSELAARHLRRSGAAHIFVTNRTFERAQELAAIFQGTPVEYTRFLGMLPEVDILITSSGAPPFILTRDDMHRSIARRATRPMSLSVFPCPRITDPSLTKRTTVF